MFESVDGRAEGSEGILELMGHIGGERLGRVDPMAQRLRHVVKRAGQEADFVAAGGKPRHRDPPCPAQTETQRGARPTPKRARACPRQELGGEYGEKDRSGHVEPERTPRWEERREGEWCGRTGKA